jgi:DNA-binding NtrC family response regulator
MRENAAMTSISKQPKSPQAAVAVAPAQVREAYETILVVDDDSALRTMLREALETEGYHVVLATGGEEALQLLRASDAVGMESRDHIALALLDVRMPGLDGWRVLQARHLDAGDTAIVMLTVLGHAEQVIRAARSGAADYICKPFDLDEALSVVRGVLDARWQARHALLYELPPLEVTRIVGSSRAMVQVFRLIETAARSDKTVLITGERGTGKELVASAIHRESDRRTMPYVALNCAAVPDTMVEVELFGSYAGVATNVRDYKGVFEQANSGTLMLDEIGAMSPAMQAKVLRALQERVVRRLGAKGVQEEPIDVRLIAATNADLKDEREHQHFRSDLFDRLHVLLIHVPPLRDRKGDIPALVAHFLKKHKPAASRKMPAITQQAMKKLLDYEWPGNVRELENVMIRALAGSYGQVITAEQVSFAALSDRSDY